MSVLPFSLSEWGVRFEAKQAEGNWGRMGAQRCCYDQYGGCQQVDSAVGGRQARATGMERGLVLVTTTMVVVVVVACDCQVFESPGSRSALEQASGAAEEAQIDERRV